MDLRERVRSDLKESMRARDQARTGTLRLFLATLQEEEGAKRVRSLDALVKARGMELRDIPSADLPAEEPLTEAEMLQALSREIKKRQDAHEAYHKAGRDELAAVEAGGIAILQSYLPTQMDTAEARARVGEIITEVGAGRRMTPADMKQVMPVVMERLRGQADGRTLNQLVRELLSN